MTEVSKQANIEQIETGKKLKDSVRITLLLGERNYTIPELILSLGVGKTTISGRLSELEEEGTVKVIGTKKIQGQSYSVYSLVDVSEREFQKSKCRNKRLLDKLKGLIKYSDLLRTETKTEIMIEMKRLSGIQNKTT